MKKVINGARYDTDTAKRLGHWDSDYNYSGLSHYSETLYRTKSGHYFLHGSGGANSRYAVQVGDSAWRGGESIAPLSDNAARAWAEQHLDFDDYDAAFGVPDDGTTQVSAYLPDSLLLKLDARKQSSGMSRSDIIIAALRAYLKMT